MGAKFFFIAFPTTDKALVEFMWMRYCQEERRRISLGSLISDLFDGESTRQLLEKDTTPRQGARYELKVGVSDDDEYYYRPCRPAPPPRGASKTSGRWRRLDLVHDASFFGEKWMYGGIPFGLGERLRYLPYTGAAGQRGSDIQEFMESYAQKWDAALAIEHGGKTYIGGLAPA